jgi:hypothetical protein
MWIVPVSIRITYFNRGSPSSMNASLSSKIFANNSCFPFDTLTARRGEANVAEAIMRSREHGAIAIVPRD